MDAKNLSETLDEQKNADGFANKHSIETYKSLIKISVEGMKVLILINGGAIVALITFLGQVMSKSNKIPDVWLPMTAFVAGIVFSVITIIFSYQTQLTLFNESMGRSNSIPHTVWLYLAFFSSVLGVGFFGVGSMLSICSFMRYNIQG